MIEVLRYNQNHQRLWDETVEKSKNGIFLYYRDYMDYHNDRFKDHSLIISKNNNIIALFPANESGAEIFSHGGLTFGSLIMTFELKVAEVLEIFSLIKNYYTSYGFQKLFYKVVPSIFHKYPAEEDLYALFKSNAQLIRRDVSSVIYIENKIKFSETKRQSVNKCEKSKIVVAENEDFSEYWNLLTLVLSKFNTKPIHSLEEILKLKACFPKQIRLFEARLNNCLLAGVIIYDYDTVAHTQYMANSLNGRKFGALTYIINELISSIFTKSRYFSFGISAESTNLSHNEGLIHYKELMGSRGIAVDLYEVALN